MHFSHVITMTVVLNAYVMVSPLFHKLSLVVLPSHFIPESDQHLQGYLATNIQMLYNVISLCIIWSTPPLSIVIMVVFLTISTKIGFLLMALYLIILLLFSQMLACTFVYKLYVLNRRTKTDSKDNSLIELMTKYTLLAIISIIGTVSLLVILVLSSLAEQSSDLVLVNHISQMSDVFLDVICVSLSMKFSANWYRRLCSGIDSKCRLCCLSLNNRLSLERSTSGSDSLANSTTTPQVEMEI
eukprot:240666_1